MKRAQRLRKAEEFQRVRARRRSWTHPLLVLFAAENGTAQSRVGIVAGRWVGNAVVRNRVKRRLRHLVRRRLAELPAASRLVVRALPPAAEATSEELDRDLGRALRRALERREDRGRPGSEGS